MSTVGSRQILAALWQPSAAGVNSAVMRTFYVGRKERVVPSPSEGALSLALAAIIWRRPNRHRLSAASPSFASIRICYGVALTGRSRCCDQVLTHGDETGSYGPIVTERPWVGYCSYARYLRQRVRRELADTEATSILRQKRGEGGKRSAAVLFYNSDPI
jgi:hypothetical protein